MRDLINKGDDEGLQMKHAAPVGGRQPRSLRRRPAPQAGFFKFDCLLVNFYKGDVVRCHNQWRIRWLLLFRRNGWYLLFDRCPIRIHRLFDRVTFRSCPFLANTTSSNSRSAPTISSSGRATFFGPGMVYSSKGRETLVWMPHQRKKQ